MAANAQHLSEDIEWYTPDWLVELCRDALGGHIDLDPATCAFAQETIGAKRFFTKSEDGLAQMWDTSGRTTTVFLNAPYCRMMTRFGVKKSSMGVWLVRALEAYVNGEIEQAILVTKSVDATRWGRVLSGFPRCKLSERVEFMQKVEGGSKVKRVPHETQVTYFGSAKNGRRFESLFKPYGRVSF